MTSRITTPLASALLALACAAHAQDPSPTGAAAMPAARSSTWDAPPVASSRLSTLRGGTALTGDATLNGSLQDTHATNVSTGANTVGGGSFANASGLPTVIQNSGANVVIQNSTIVNVVFKP